MLIKRCQDDDHDELFMMSGNETMHVLSEDEKHIHVLILGLENENLIIKKFLFFIYKTSY